MQMGAVITLNGVRLGVATDQFLRYSFPVGAVLKPTGNTLRLTFDNSIDTGSSLGPYTCCMSLVSSQCTLSMMLICRRAFHGLHGGLRLGAVVDDCPALALHQRHATCHKLGERLL
jgi:hypothetical protein